MAKRALFEMDKRLLWKFLINMGYRGVRSVQKHKARMKKGEYFPPFLYISIINSCNLRCQGCWVDVAHDEAKIEVEAMNKLINEAKEVGNSFFGILGGEPFMHPELFEILESHPDCYFQIFTNGQFITDEVAKRLRAVGNATPLISVEGSEIVSDERRGREGVYSKTMRGLHAALDNKLITGVCSSLCQSNFEDLLNEAWLDKLIDMGVMYSWFHVYRPVGPIMHAELALTPDQQLEARKFVVEMRAKKPIAIIDAYYDGNGEALCPAATGMSHHINPWGDIEPCPIVQFTQESIHEDRHIRETFAQSEFLKDFRETAAKATRGCIVLERPDLLKELVDRHGAKDSTARKTAMAELESMEALPSQHRPGTEIPEKSLVYRLVKKFWFNDFGTYARAGNGTNANAKSGNRNQETGVQSEELFSQDVS